MRAQTVPSGAGIRKLTSPRLNTTSGRMAQRPITSPPKLNFLRSPREAEPVRPPRMESSPRQDSIRVPSQGSHQSPRIGGRYEQLFEARRIMSFVDVAVAHRELPTFSAALEKGLAAPLSAYEKTHAVAWSFRRQSLLCAAIWQRVGMGWISSSAQHDAETADDPTDRNIDQLVETATQSMKTCSTTPPRSRMSVSLPPVDARQKQQARHQDAASTPRQDVEARG